MSRNGRILTFVAIALIAAFTVRVVRRVSQTQMAIKARAPSCDALQAEVRDLKQRLQTTEAMLATLDQAMAALRSESGKTDDGGENGGARADDKPGDKLSPMTILSTDPQKLAEYLHVYRGGLAWQFGSIFNAIRATPEQIEKFKDAEISLYETGIDLRAATELHRLDPDSEASKKLWLSYNEARVKTKEDALGDLIKPYLDYLRTWAVRDFAADLAYASVFSGEPICAAQISRTGEILVANSQRHGFTDRKKSGPWANVGDVNWEAARPQLKDILSPNQIETLGALFAKEFARIKLDAVKNRLTAQFTGKSPQK